MPEDSDKLQRAIGEIADAWRTERAERLGRRHLERGDFDALRDAGLLRATVPEEDGGPWRDAPSSARGVCDLYRRLAAADPSVALVSAMHPAVLAFWVSTTDPAQPEWEEQRHAVFASAAAGDQWATITSEPGSGGDIMKTRATAAALDGGEAYLPGRPYAVTGDKHFGSGSGIADRMMTTAVPDGDGAPTIFVLDVRGKPWDGSTGLKLVAEWDGVGMAATQSHAMRLEAAPAIRMAWDGPLEAITMGAGPMVSTLFTAVVLGVLDEAVATARAQLGPKADQLRAYEQVEWARADQAHWLAAQAYDGALRAIESGDPRAALAGAIRAKQSVAELAEQALLGITRVVGGGTFSQRSPFSHWFEDVRALGFLRPPWGLATDALFASSF